MKKFITLEEKETTLRKDKELVKSESASRTRNPNQPWQYYCSFTFI